MLEAVSTAVSPGRTPRPTPICSRIVSSLADYTDAELERATDSGAIFFDARWYRWLEAIDLARAVRFPIALRYAVAERDGVLVAVCPLFDVSAASVHYVYSFERSFFTSWQQEVESLHPSLARVSSWLAAVVNGLRRAVRVTGIRTDRFTLVASPLAFRGSVAHAAMTSLEVQRAIDVVVGEVKRHAEVRGRIAWFLRYAHDETALRASLAAAGFDELYALSEPRIDGIEGGLDGYRARFRAEGRRKVNVELKKVQSAGVRFERAPGIDGHEPRMIELHEAMNRKYGEEHFSLVAEDLRAMHRRIGDRAEHILAWREDALVGYVTLLRKGEDLWAYRAGLDRGADHIRFLYFSLAYYEPIRRSETLGARRYWLGPGAWDTKHRRGAVGVPLYNAFWFPTMRERAVLLPYLRAFSRVAERELAFLSTPHSSLQPIPGHACRND